jgi:hypothetical protein
MRRYVVTAGLVFALALSGCGSDDKKADSGSTSSSTTTSSTSTTTTTAPCHFVGTTDPQENALAPVDQLLTDVTTSTDGCVDSVTFTFRPSSAPAPSYKIEYATGPFMNSAGETVTPAGAVFLKVRFQPAWIADLSMESAPLTYTGPRVITPTGLKTVRGLALFDASEAVVGWVIGLDAQHPFAVDASAGKVVIKVG